MRRSDEGARGLTRLEVIAILAVIAALLAVARIMLGKARIQALAQHDVTAIRCIHAGFVTEAGNRGQGAATPLPGVVKRSDAEQPEDFTLNHSANIYSMMVMQEYLAPELLVSPVETAPYVQAADYRYEVYDPAAGAWWDPTFVMRIDDPAIGANASYAHVVAVGERRHPPGSAVMPALANRAPPPWARPGQPEHDRSPTLRFHPPRTSWSGYACFSDNHIELLTTYYPATWQGRPDHIFASEFDHPLGQQAAGDAFLAIYSEATEFTVKPVYDRPE